MAYVKRKRIKGRDYYYLAESYRADGRVKTRTVTYLGTSPDVPEEFRHLIGGQRRQRRDRQATLWGCPLGGSDQEKTPHREDDHAG